MRKVHSKTPRGKFTVKPRVGMAIRGDQWRSCEILESSDWDKAEFRHTIHGNGPVTSMACNIRVTGRTLQNNKFFYKCIRVEISVPDDGDELGCVFSGWLSVGNSDLIYSEE